MQLIDPQIALVTPTSVFLYGREFALTDGEKCQMSELIDQVMRRVVTVVERHNEHLVQENEELKRQMLAALMSTEKIDMTAEFSRHAHDEYMASLKG